MKRHQSNGRGNSSAARRQPDLSLTKVRSALSNGSRLVMGDVDERGAWCRRLRDLQRGYAADMGGPDRVSEGQAAIMRRAAMIELQLEMMESRWAANEGEASAKELEVYQRATGALRRLIESLDLHKGRVARDVTPTAAEYVARKAAEQRSEAGA